jgi:hypothetical protein
VINFAFGFVPGTIGVYETGNGIILRTLGYTTAIGLALAIVRKAAIIFWTVIGVFILTWRAVPNAWASLLHRSPRLQKLADSLVLSNIAHRPARTAVSIAGIALGVLLVVFTVGLAHGMLRERGRREANINAEILLRPPGNDRLERRAVFHDSDRTRCRTETDRRSAHGRPDRPGTRSQ